MSQHVGHIVELIDAEHQQIGQMHIERQEEDLLWGTFVPGPAFPNVAQLFQKFEAAVEVQALHVIETLDVAIAALGLHLQRPTARTPIAVQDVQIWSDGTITCRLCDRPVTSVKTTSQAQSSRRLRRQPTA